MKRKDVLRAIGRLALWIFIRVIRVLPFPIALAVGRGLGRLMCAASKRRYQVALKNLGIAFGEALTPEQRHAMARQSFVHFGMFAVECIKFAYMNQQEALRRIRTEGFEHLQSVMDQGKGCLLLSAHLGNFEIGARVVTAAGYELFALARETRDAGTTDLMQQIRTRMGIKVVTINQSLRPVLEGLKRNAVVAIICDQNAADVFVPFFGRPTGTVSGPARLALKTGAPIVTFACTRDGGGGYCFHFQEPYRPQPTGDPRADIEAVTAVINSRLEELISRTPEQWLWFHDRWKSSPGAAQDAS
ncbi:MAG: lysophospholipid acyltransferase family protein [Chthonomonadales bacterium]